MYVKSLLGLYSDAIYYLYFNINLTMQMHTILTKVVLL